MAGRGDAAAVYFESLEYTAEGRPKTPPPAAKPEQEISVERGLEHHAYFIQSLREGLPSKRTRPKATTPPAPRHLANIAYRKGRRIHWDLKTSNVTEA